MENKKMVRWNIDKVKYFVEVESGSECRLISNTYKNNHTKLDFICKCGERFSTSFKEFRSKGNRRKPKRQCNICGYKNISHLKTKTYSDFLNEISHLPCTLVSKYYAGSSVKLKFMCSCGKVFEREPRAVVNMKQYSCLECVIQAVSGENNYNWNPSLTDEERFRARDYKEYVDWRDCIYKRDGYTCQCCGERGGNLHAHHIYNYSEHDDIKLDPVNGITWCDVCHKRFHDEYGYTNNDFFQFEEYMNKYAKTLIPQ